MDERGKYITLTLLYYKAVEKVKSIISNESLIVDYAMRYGINII